jgi:two-component system sensor histidine kinase UhpB
MAETRVALADVLELLRWLAAGLSERGLSLRVDDATGASLLDDRSQPVPQETALAFDDGSRWLIALGDPSEARVRENDAREDERRRLANQVHDSIAQTLTSLAIHAEVLSGVIQHGIEETRVMAQRLRPPELQSGGLEAALRSLLASTRNVDGRVQGKRNPRDSGTPEREALALYRLVETLLEPAAAAREPWQVNVTTTCKDNGELQLEVDIRGECEPLGLASTRTLGEPIEAMGGRVVLVTSATHRTVVRAYLPCTPRDRS